MLVVAFFNMTSALLILVLERTRMIGLLKVLGMRSRQIRAVFLWRAAFVALRGLGWGNLVGLGLCVLQHTTHLVKLNPEGYLLSEVPISLGWGWWLALNAGFIAVIVLLLMIPALFFMDFHPALRQMLKPVNLFNFAYLGLGASALCFATWNWSLKILGAVRVSIYIYLVPVIAVIAAVLILHERMTPMALAGIILTLFGLFVSEIRNTGPLMKRMLSRK